MQKNSRRVLALVLALVMALSVFSISASAYNANYQSETHTVFKHTEQTLAPGVEFYKNYAYAKADGEQMVYYVTTADITRDDVIVQTSYKEQYKDRVLGMQRLRDQVAFANDYYSDPDSPQFISEYYNVVSGCNASFYNTTTGQPTGVCFIDGVDFGTAAYPCFFAILKDGTAICDDRTNKGSYTGEQAIWQAVGGSQWIVRNGQDVTSGISGSYNTDRADRSCVGVTADGKVVIMSLDGRQIPYSCGGSMHEIAQIMLEAGCVAAINVDGGGSTTFMAKEEGEDSIHIVNRPSDGSDRSISSGIIIASTAAPSNVFSRATLTAENNYMTVNATQTISAKGISPAGTSADIPAEATLTTDNGTISADGTFVPAHVGDATIQLVYNNDVVGETVVHVVDPTRVAFNITTLAVPYGQSSDIDIHLYYGEYNYDVLFVPEDLSFTISNPSFGQINGLTFTATNDTTVTGSSTLTVTSTANAGLTQTIPLVVGKGSEVIFDFEDQDVSRWSGDDMYFADVTTTCTAVNAETGKVHSGNYALAYNMNFSQPTYYEDYIASKMCYNAAAIKEHGVTQDAEGKNQHGLTEDYVDITGAVGLGFWVYLPDEVAVNAFDPDFRISGKKTATAEWSYCNGYMDDICDANGLLVTNGDSNQEGWYYFHFDLSNFSSYYKLRLQDARPNHTVTKQGRTEKYYGDFLNWYITDAAWKKAGIKSYNSNFTLYIDDFTVDYSSVVPDREAPVFSNPTYAFTGASDALALNNGATIAANGIEFAVSVAENTAKTNASGLKTASIKAYVDGVEVNASYSNGKIAVPETTFANGIHTVMFEASDNTGNTSHMTRTFTVSGSADLDTIKVVPRNADAEATLVGSLYYVDIVATDPSKIANVNVSLKVNNVNDWELEGVEAAEGFAATASLEAYDKGIVDLTITGDGSATSTDEAVIASIPVRTWYPHNVKDKDSAWLIANKRVYPIDTQIHVKKGAVEFADGEASTFNAAKIQIDSEAMCPNGSIGVQKGDATSWHTHNAHAVDPKDPTCTEDGYTGRTFCDECNSVVDWGTVVPATGHDFALDLEQHAIVCKSCGEIDTSFTGVFENDGKYYYAKFGVLGSGWIMVGDDYYYFDKETFEGKEGVVSNHDVMNSSNTFTYTFENGKLLHGEWVKLADGTRYYYGPNYYAGIFAAVDGKTYYFDKKGYYLTGYQLLTAGSNSHQKKWHFFDENGVDQTPLSGLHQIDGDLYYLEDGWPIHKGLIKEGDDYYYIRSNGIAAVDCACYAYITNCDLPAEQTYEFGADGKMIISEPDPVKNGIVDGYYYENDELVYAGLIKINDDYYYVRSSGIVATNGTYYAYKTSCDLPANREYKFDENGKMINPPAPHVGVKNGIVDGYYYENDELVYAGLIKLDGDYYYIRSAGNVAKNGSYYAYKTSCDLPADTRYEFDADGKMIDPYTYYLVGSMNNWTNMQNEYKFVKNTASDANEYVLFGVKFAAETELKVQANNNAWYPDNAANMPIHDAGIYDIYFRPDYSGDSAWYNGCIYASRVGDIPAVKNGIVDGYYYENDRIVYAGLIKLNDDYYYVRSSGIVATNGTYFAYKTSCDLPADREYKFDEDGKMINPPTPYVGVKNGIVDGYYYENDQIVYKGLTKIGDDYYYIRTTGIVAKNGSYYAYKTSCDLPADTRYEFDADGKMIR